MNSINMCQLNWKYVTEKVIEWFDNNQENSVDWILGRKAAEGKEDRTKDRDRTIEYIKKRINDDDFIKSILKYKNNSLNEKDILLFDILLFLISWNIRRFKKVLDPNDIGRWLETIKFALDICNKNNGTDETIFYEVLDKYKSITGKNEKVITAKTLFIIRPDKFIAWDNQIINLFFVNQGDIARMYALFNQAVNKFLSLHDLKYYIKDYITTYYYYNDRKLLDMILYIFANHKINNFEFLCNSCKIIAGIRSIIHMDNSNTS